LKCEGFFVSQEYAVFLFMLVIENLHISYNSVCVTVWLVTD